jgi:hypothetical protein
MQPLLWFVLGLVVAFGGQAAAEFVGPYGESLPYSMPNPTGDGIGFRDKSGHIHYPPLPPPTVHMPNLKAPC